MNKANEANSVM